MSRRSQELAAALVRTQSRVRNTERKLAVHMAAERAGSPRHASQHRELRTELAQAQNDVDVLQRELRRESERPFDLLAAKMAVQ